MTLQIVLDDSLSPRVHAVTEVPQPGQGQVRVRVSRAGVNFWEVMQRRGRVPLPEHRVPGSEGVGVVEAVGDVVDHLVVGQRVAWSKVHGSYAEVVVGPAAAFAPVPDAVPDEVAAALLFQGATAYYLAHDSWQLTVGDVAVVTAAAGGVGVLLTQLLVSAGVQVIGVVSNPEKADAARRAGASQVFTYGDSLVEEIRGVAPQGVAVVYDAVGAGVAEPLLATLRPRGAMVLYGSASGQDADISAKDLGRASLFLTRAAGRDYAGDAHAAAERAALLLDLAARGVLRPELGGEYPLAEAASALDALESRATVGKLLLVP
jgi:NADPH2:quinone reductase